ncbi:lariat debranching enzyme, C-terminal domain-containing protein [Rhexocercosporidium sp. MPI-PUGE-AT-0058]|nr:lariat debranching enzyme, C-terminal domain-containing protein [Rhexocercosporidium sp. MPI-PUGE-AT-0058]
MNPALEEAQGLRIAVEGCGHGTLDAIYASVGSACEARGWDGVDLLIIGGDFQSVRNASDLTVMSCPVKYREIGDFHAYYSGTTKAPYLTIFVGGNHEASSHLWELFYGGWVAPNIYYMGAANVVRVGGVRIAGMSGIWKGYNFNKSHHERLPYSQDDVKSIYHVREIDTRKLLQLRTQVDIGISHDWPRAIEKSGNAKALWRMKPDFEQESKDGTLGNQAATFVMDRLRPPYWFSAHMHCKFAATKTYDNAPKSSNLPVAAPPPVSGPTVQSAAPTVTHNSDEIDLDMDDDDDDDDVTPAQPIVTNGTAPTNQDEISLDDDDEAETLINGTSISKNTEEIDLEDETIGVQLQSSVPSDLRAQLPAAFARPAASSARGQPGQPSPPKITNKVVRFLALDKCLPGRKFLQLLEVPRTNTDKDARSHPKAKFEYDPEWLAITRVFAPHIVLGDKHARAPNDIGEANYLPLIEKEQVWVEENVVKRGKLEIPENFVLTAPTFEVGMPEIVDEGPVEYNNPQMQEFCDLIGIENKFFSTEEERERRMKNGPPPAEQRRDGGFGGRGGGRGRGGHRGRGGGGRGDRGRGRGGGRGRGRGW